MQRPLSGRILGISISEGEDMFEHGFRPGEVESVTLELCRRFVALGASVVLGHQWRPNGVMEAVTRFARAYITEPDRKEPIIHNFLGWPDRAAIPEKERKELREKLLVQIHEQSSELPRREALRKMRSDMAGLNHARLCLGGRLVPSSGRSVSGVLEEAALCRKKGVPVFYSAMMGGVSRLMVEASKRDRDIEKCLGRFDSFAPRGRLSPEMRKATKEYLAAVAGSPADIRKRTPLDEESLEALWHAENIDTIVHIVARGLRRG